MQNTIVQPGPVYAALISGLFGTYVTERNQEWGHFWHILDES